MGGCVGVNDWVSCPLWNTDGTLEGGQNEPEQMVFTVVSTCFPVGWAVSTLLTSWWVAIGSTVLASVRFCGVLFLKSYFVMICICGPMINMPECVFTSTCSYISAAVSFSIGLVYACCFLLFFFLLHLLRIFSIMILCELCFTSVSDWSWSFPFQVVILLSRSPYYYSILSIFSLWFVLFSLAA